MITKEINVERNYRIDNQDQYMKARLSHTVVPEEGEQMQTCTLHAIEMLDTAFRIAYPHVDEHLNFHVERQVNENYAPLPKDYVRNQRVAFSEPPNHSNKELIQMQGKSGYPVADVETVKKEMKSYRLGAPAFKAVYSEQVKNNPELEAVYNEKLAEFEAKK